MPVEVIMPKVDMDMTAGRFSGWHVQEGEEVAKGAPLFDIETDKSTMEVESPASGRLHHLLAKPDQTIDVGSPVAWIYADGEAVGERPDAAAPQPERPTPEAAPPAPSAPAFDPDAHARAAQQPAYGSSAAPDLPTAPVSAPAAPQDRPRATPAARHLARNAGLDLGLVPGTGPQGRIQGADVSEVLRARAKPASEPMPRPVVPAVPALPADAPPAPTWSAQEGELHVSRRPGTGTPILLIHGFTADSAGWAPFERELPRDLPLLRIDLPSHGRSPRSHAQGFPDLLRAVTRTFDASCDGPVHLLGHSLGGALALGLADIRPRQVASLTLLAPAGLGPEVDAATLQGIARASRTESLAPWLQRLTASPDAISWGFAQAAMLARTDPALRAAQLDLADALFPDGVQGFDLRAALSRVEAPTALVWGRDDAILPWRHALSAKGEMALHLLPGVGHIPHVECPARLAGIVARHLGHFVR